MEISQAYTLMLRIRFFEEAIEKLFLEGRVMGTAHTCIGQEATAVGVAAALAPQDYMTTTHRGHGHFIARGAVCERVMAELFGRTDGYSRGRGGSQMMMDPTIGFYGSNGITGGSIPFATGLALSAHLQQSEAVTICFFGDGASNQGVFHEALNLAALWKLPILYVIENNGYAMSTPTTQGVASEDLSKRALSYDMPGLRVDGNDFLAVREQTTKILERVRQGHGPALMECLTYRLSGHSRGDPRVYRTRAEEETAWRNDPITRLEEHLQKVHAYTPAQLEATRQAAQAHIAAAIDFAENSPLGDPALLWEDLYAE